jgi:hypothetical protein
MQEPSFFTTDLPVAVAVAHGTPEYSVPTAKPVVTSAPGGVGHVAMNPNVGDFVDGHEVAAKHVYEPSASFAISAYENAVGTAAAGVAQPPAYSLGHSNRRHRKVCK